MTSEWVRKLCDREYFGFYVQSTNEISRPQELTFQGDMREANELFSSLHFYENNALPNEYAF